MDMSFKKCKKEHAFNAIFLVFDWVYLNDEITQVNGTVTIVDLSGYTLKHQTGVSMEDRKNLIQTWQVSSHTAHCVCSP